ncbi:MAG: hypothetical protein M1836_003212 [Candelina mexicana]|nr:MAG: hypothetical protein M1836_003212 [Candelina mexicana]
MSGRGGTRRARPPPPPVIDFAEAGPGPSTEEREQQSNTSTRGTKCELKQLDGRYDHLGNYNVTDSAVNTIGEDAEVEPHAEYALVSTRVYGVDGLYQSTQLEIKSRFIKKALRKVIKYYPGQPVDTAQVILNDPPKPLFHYRKELEDYKHAKADEETKKHLELLFKFVDSVLKSQVERFKDLTKRGITAFSLVWMLFKPGDIVYTEKDGQPCCYMIAKCDVSRNFFGKSWHLTCIGTNYDGSKFGKTSEVLKIPQFEGTRDITSLNVFPLRFHSQESQVKARLLERGNRFFAMRGCQHMSYKGMAHVVTNRMKSGYDSDDCGMDGEYTYQSTAISGRIMVDAESFGRVNPGNRVRFDGTGVSCDCSVCRMTASPSAGEPDPESNLSGAAEEHTVTALSEKDTLLCPPFVFGFSLLNKKWCRFFLDYVKDVELNHKAFEQLIIAESHKQLVLAMVESHVEDDDSFDDIIQGKGKSLIILLHGAPGVGKTLTAESIADHTKRPLYTVSSGELGTHPADVEEKLTHVLDIATTWKAVVLLDEADVFLQQRSGSDVNRNALVSIFLRLLEYYEGILFLTSNRVEEFDLAFKSRIHVALHYPELSLTVRRQLWKDFLLRLPKETLDLNMEKDLDVLQHDVINGRQIKNACKTAAALARKRNEKLSIKHLETTLVTIREFEKDFARGAHPTVNGLS